MKLHTSSGIRKLDARTIRMAFTTEDIGRLIGCAPDKVGRLIRQGDLVFTGDAVKDFHTISTLRSKALSKLK